MTDPAPIIHINGWAGCGKRTIAVQLTQMIGARLLDNHTLLNPALALFDRGTEDNQRLRQDIRNCVFAAARTLPADTPLVLTDAFADAEYERGLFADVARFAAETMRPLTRFNLEIEEGENIRRLTSTERNSHRKLTDPDILRSNRQTFRLLGHDDPDVQTVDVTQLSATEAASRLRTRLSTTVHKP